MFLNFVTLPASCRDSSSARTMPRNCRGLKILALGFSSARSRAFWMEISAWPSCQNDVDVIEQTLQELNWLASLKGHKKNTYWNRETNHKLAPRVQLLLVLLLGGDVRPGARLITHAPHSLLKSKNQPSHYNGTLQWHHVHSTKVGRHPPPNHSTLQWPYEGTQQWHHVHCTLQWRPAMAPRPLNHSTLQWHPPTAPSNGTLQWHHVHSTIAHYNGTLQWHHVDCTLLWHSGAPSNAQKWFVALPPYWK